MNLDAIRVRLFWSGVILGFSNGVFENVWWRLAVIVAVTTYLISSLEPKKED